MKNRVPCEEMIRSGRNPGLNTYNESQLVKNAAACKCDLKTSITISK